MLSVPGDDLPSISFTEWANEEARARDSRGGEVKVERREKDNKERELRRRREGWRGGGGCVTDRAE